jgi:hypothetical protein
VRDDVPRLSGLCSRSSFEQVSADTESNKDLTQLEEAKDHGNEYMDITPP